RIVPQIHLAQLLPDPADMPGNNDFIRSQTSRLSWCVFVAPRASAPPRRRHPRWPFTCPAHPWDAAAAKGVSGRTFPRNRGKGSGIGGLSSRATVYMRWVLEAISSLHHDDGPDAEVIGGAAVQDLETVEGEGAAGQDAIDAHPRVVDGEGVAE